MPPVWQSDLRSISGGVLVGTVRRVEVTDQAVLTDLVITDPKLRLSRPVVARVGVGSLLGGDAVVALLSSGQPLPKTLPGPRERGCDNKRMVCDQGKVQGMTAPGLETVTETVQQLLEEGGTPEAGAPDGGRHQDV